MNYAINREVLLKLKEKDKPFRSERDSASVSIVNREWSESTKKWVPSESSCCSATLDDSVNNPARSSGLNSNPTRRPRECGDCGSYDHEIGAKWCTNAVSAQLSMTVNEGIKRILRALRIAKVEKQPWREALKNYLLMYNTTPHSVFDGVLWCAMVKLLPKLKKAIINLQTNWCASDDVPIIKNEIDLPGLMVLPRCHGC